MSSFSKLAFRCFGQGDEKCLSLDDGVETGYVYALLRYYALLRRRIVACTYLNGISKMILDVCAHRITFVRFALNFNGNLMILEDFTDSSAELNRPFRQLLRLLRDYYVAITRSVYIPLREFLTGTPR